jgi:nucleotide-binding universal stress UspA family protein
MNILVPTDFSTRSFRALRQAGLLAQAGGRLHVLHVVDDDQPADLLRIETREAERILREQISSVPELHGVDAQVLVVPGDPFDGILRSARDVAADLIVMGAHRRQLLDIFTGTTIERVIRKGTVPVLMVNNEAQRTYQKVIAPIDMSEASADALRAGISTGLISNEGATLVHAFPAWARGKMYIAGADAAAIAKYVDDERRNASNELRAFLTANHLDEARWTLRIQEGEAIEVISRVVSDVQADLLVMGTHGRSGFLKTLIGSVTEEALRSLSVDILAVPRSGSP